MTTSPVGRHSTFIGHRAVRTADRRDSSMPFSRCTCGWEGAGRLKRSAAVEDGFEHLLKPAAESDDES